MIFNGGLSVMELGREILLKHSRLETLYSVGYTYTIQCLPTLYNVDRFLASVEETVLYHFFLSVGTSNFCKLLLWFILQKIFFVPFDGFGV